MVPYHSELSVTLQYPRILEEQCGRWGEITKRLLGARQCAHTQLCSTASQHVPGASQVWRCRAGGEGPCGEKVHGLTCVHAEGRDRLQLAEPRRLKRGYQMRSKNSGEAPTFLTEAGEVLSSSVHVSI